MRAQKKRGLKLEIFSEYLPEVHPGGGMSPKMPIPPAIPRPSHVLGIDPGNFGAFALLDLESRKVHTIWDMPTKDGKVYPEGVAMVVDLAKSIASGGYRFRRSPRQPARRGHRNVSSRPRQAHAFSFGLGVGIIHGCLGSLNVPFSLVAPQQWKSSFGLCRVGDESQAGTKARARELASRLWPESAELFTRVKDADRAEAALIFKILGF